MVAPKGAVARSWWILGALLAILACVQAGKKAAKQEHALIRWRPAIEKLSAGESPYHYDSGDGAEGFPTTPLNGVLLRPFLVLPDRWAGVSYAAFKALLAGWMLATGLTIASRGERAPPWSGLLLLVLTFRVLRSDIVHGNTNIPVAAVVMASALAWRRGLDAMAGLWAGLACVLKVTPGLLLVFFVWKRSRDAAIGFIAGLILFALALPGSVLGFWHNLDLLGQWWEQMIAPFLGAESLDLRQTEHINQSLLGTGARWLTDAVAIVAREGTWPEDVRIGVLSLSDGAYQWLFRGFAVALLSVSLWGAGKSSLDSRASSDSGASHGSHRNERAAVEFAVVCVLMLLLSERTWKHHHVLLVLPLAWLAVGACDPLRHSRERLIKGLLSLLAFATLTLSGSGVLGDRGSDLAEAYGVFTAIDLLLFAALVRELRRAEPQAVLQLDPTQGSA